MGRWGYAFWRHNCNTRPDGTLTTGVYRKPTTTDQHLEWESHHHIAAKYSIMNTVIHRAKAICSTPGLVQADLQHIQEALTNCKYPKWA